MLFTESWSRMLLRMILKRNWTLSWSQLSLRRHPSSWWLPWCQLLKSTFSLTEKSWFGRTIRWKDCTSSLRGISRLSIWTEPKGVSSIWILKRSLKTFLSISQNLGKKLEADQRTIRFTILSTTHRPMTLQRSSSTARRNWSEMKLSTTTKLSSANFESETSLEAKVMILSRRFPVACRQVEKTLKIKAFWQQPEGQVVHNQFIDSIFGLLDRREEVLQSVWQPPKAYCSRDCRRALFRRIQLGGETEWPSGVEEILWEDRGVGDQGKKR